MASMINYGGEEIRINFDKNNIEYSTNGGRTWHTRCRGTIEGEFRDLTGYGSEIIACTSKGVYYSDNDGRTWHSRYKGNSYGDFEEIQDNGDELLATTSKGLYYSENDGRTWHKR